MKLVIGYLYGDLMNIYGDTGNIICLQQRAKWREIEVEVRQLSLGDQLKPKQIDLYFFGGGQDLAQQQVSQDLTQKDKGEIIKQEVTRGVPLLAICGGYQLLGDYYQPHQGPRLPGISLFPAYTLAGHKRMIGNIILETQLFNDQVEAQKNKIYLVGFENHSGKTYLKEGAVPLGRVIKGYGNNGEDRTEGCVYHNAIGCYLHGSFLPKNPIVADWLLAKALEVKYQHPIKLTKLPDQEETQAHHKILKLFL